MSFLNEHPPRWAAKFSEWIVVRGPAGGVYLTFDDGPDPDTTLRFLDQLASLDCLATFFMLGEKVAKHPSLARRVAETGHTIGIHGYTHESWLLKSSEWVGKEIERTRSAIFDATGVNATLCRPPYGRIGPGALKSVRELGLPFILWTICPDDWKPTPPADLVLRATEKTHDGDIILLHDSGRGAETTLAALPYIVSALRDKGLKPISLFTTVILNPSPPGTQSNCHPSSAMGEESRSGGAL